MNCPKCGASGLRDEVSVRFTCCSYEWNDAPGEFMQSADCMLACAEKRIKELEDGLRPFADASEVFNTMRGFSGKSIPDENPVVAHYALEDMVRIKLEVGHLRTAAKLLEKKD